MRPGALAAKRRCAEATTHGGCLKWALIVWMLWFAQTDIHLLRAGWRKCEGPFHYSYFNSALKLLGCARILDDYGIMRAGTYGHRAAPQTIHGQRIIWAKTSHASFQTLENSSTMDILWHRRYVQEAQRKQSRYQRNW